MTGKQLRKRALVFGVIVLVSFFSLQIVGAQEYPTKPVNLVIPFGAGGGHDMNARAIAGVAPQYLGQPIIIQLKPGGGGAIASDFVAQSKPDGYTLLLGGPGPNSTLPAIEGRSKGPDDLIAVCRFNYAPIVITIRADAPFKTFKEMIEWAKANPGKLVYGTTGPWGAADLPFKQVVQMTGISVKTVHHDGGGPALTAILGGHVDAMGAFTSHSLPHIKAGKVRPILVMDEKRENDLPDVPTAKEMGLNIIYYNWKGVLAPKGTPRPIVDKISLSFKNMCTDSSLIEMVKKLGDDIQYLGTDEFAKAWRQEYESHKEIGKQFKK